MKSLNRALYTALALLVLVLPCAAFAQPNSSNGNGSITRPNTSGSIYGSGAVTKLLTTTAGATPMAITVNDTAQGANIITGARMYSTGTGLSGAAFKIYLYTAPPTLTGLADAATYVGPYLADLNGFVGTLICASFVPTNDASSEYWSECSIGNLVNQTLRFPDTNGSSVISTLYGAVEVTTGYTTIVNEVETLQLTTLRSE